MVDLLPTGPISSRIFFADFESLRRRLEIFDNLAIDSSMPNNSLLKSYIA